MEVVLLLAVIVGVALIVIPRLQRRKAAGRRPAVVKARGTSAKRFRARKTVAAAPVVAAPAVASWSPPAGTASPDLDVWEDDLGWEGEDGATPEAREEWQQWRTKDSPLAPPAPEPELPSVERWRAEVSEDDWLEDDDDGLGWEGEQATPSGPGLRNGNGHAPTHRSGADGQPPESGSWNRGRDGSRSSDAPAPRKTESAPAFVTASAATDVAPAPAAQPELGRTVALEDEDWDPPVGTAWGVRENGRAAAPAKASPGSRRGSRTSRVHPVLRVAIYAAVGIGLVVLASTVLLGGSTDPTPASKAPAGNATASATPQAGATPDSAAEEAAAAAATAARNDFGRERANAVRSHDAAISAARVDARREARARAKAKARANARAAERKRNRSQSSSSSTSSPSSGSGGNSSYTPTPTYTPPSNPAPSAPAPKRRSVCEFCIG